MIAVIDAGGTKTEMAIGDQAKKEIRRSDGINPYFQSDDEIQNRLKGLLLPTDQVEETIERVFYYGTGCSAQDQIRRVANQLAYVFPGAAIQVEHDLMGACRALCFHEPGIVGILGTGSNACIFNGKTIEKQMISLGFWLGDEGSGGNLGKTLLTNWLKNRMPTDLDGLFSDWTGLKKSSALAAVYSDKNANKAVARFAAFAVQNRTHPYISGLISENFRLYFSDNMDLVRSASEYPFHFTGSIAQQLEAELVDVARNLNIRVGKIVGGPTDELYRYHLQNQ